MASKWLSAGPVGGLLEVGLTGSGADTILESDGKVSEVQQAASAFRRKLAGICSLLVVMH